MNKKFKGTLEDMVIASIILITIGFGFYCEFTICKLLTQIVYKFIKKG